MRGSFPQDSGCVRTLIERRRTSFDTECGVAMFSEVQRLGRTSEKGREAYRVYWRRMSVEQGASNPPEREAMDDHQSVLPQLSKYGGTQPQPLAARPVTL